MKNKLNNMKKYIGLSQDAWQETDEHGLLTIPTKHTSGNTLKTENNFEFINLNSCSYLGLNTHPNITQGAIEAIKEAGSLNFATSRLRVRLNMLNKTEDMLSQHLKCEAMTAISCGVASYSILPMIASGHFTNNTPPIMIFDRFAHLSMHRVKPICAEETEVINCPNNDLNFIEDICKKNPSVAYVTDGVFSIGGHTPLKELLTLQDKYGLFLYFDDSHSFSVYGDKGQGFVRTLLQEMNEKTIVTASLVKSFAASGAVIMFKSKKQKKDLDRFGGPLSWSQCIDTAAMGAIQASIKIHQSDELGKRQLKLKENLKFFDNLILTRHTGTEFPVRIIDLKTENEAIKSAKKIYDKGFFTSSVFFPVVPKGNAGLRLMIRSDLSIDDINNFFKALKESI